MAHTLDPDAIQKPIGRFTTRGLLDFLCLVLLCGILYAGLHPFHVPANQVTWVAGSNGVRLGEHGTIFGSGSFQPSASAGAERSIEIWVEPGMPDASNTLLAFYSPASPRQLWLSQSEGDLEIHTQPSAAWRNVRTNKFYIGDAFRDGKNAFWTLTSGQSGTEVYRNGALVRKVRSFRLSGSDLSGQLVVGNSPIFHESWSGVLRGLAIYDKALNRAEVARHYASWEKTRTPSLTALDACIALYLFDEHAGNIIHNRVRGENDLYIPQKFSVLRQTLLDPVWRAFNWRQGFWEDTLINIAGFVPYGLFFCACFWARGIQSPAVKASLLGAAVSLSIEILQSHLPTRDSSMSDVITNSLGAILGAMAYRGIVRRTLDNVIARIVGAWSRYVGRSSAG